MRPRKSSLLAMLLLVLGLSFSLAKDSADEQAIRTLDTAWSKAAQARDLDKTVSYYADDASMFPPNMPIATGKDAIRAVWSQLLSMPGSVTFTPSKIVVAKSGDLAYEIGAFQITGNDAQGKPAISTGKFVVAWQKHSGRWKVVADIFNDDK